MGGIILADSSRLIIQEDVDSMWVRFVTTKEWRGYKDRTRFRVPALIAMLLPLPLIILSGASVVVLGIALVVLLATQAFMFYLNRPPTYSKLRINAQGVRLDGDLLAWSDIDHLEHQDGKITLVGMDHNLVMDMTSHLPDRIEPLLTYLVEGLERAQGVGTKSEEDNQRTRQNRKALDDLQKFLGG